jgi:putative ABC transport system permease protein
VSAVWAAARAAVRRRRLQSTVIALVVLFSSATIVVALALLVAATGPFDRVFAQQRGAHLSVSFDAAQTDTDEAAQTGALATVSDSAGPFGMTAVDLESEVGSRPGRTTTVVGRDAPAGGVDEVDLWDGAWADEPGEIVMEGTPGDDELLLFYALGSTVRAPDGTSLTVVGHAHSVSETAGAWVAPEQMDAFGPTGFQMLYRLHDHAAAADVTAAAHDIAAASPAGSVLATQSYLTTKAAVAAGPGSYLVFLMTFGVLGLLVAVLIVANVVSGAVVSGFRHIGMLKALGFTPVQVVCIYLVMVSVPASVGAGLGTLIGHAVAQPLLSESFQEIGLGSVQVDPRVDLAALVGMPLMVLLAALGPTMRAHRLSAVEAVSAGAATHSGRGLRLQRRLTGSRLPRPISLGLGLPLARPGRTALTAAAVVLGVTTATFASGVVASVTTLEHVTRRSEALDVRVAPEVWGEHTAADAETTLLILEGLPDARAATATVDMELTAAGHTRTFDTRFILGESTDMGYPQQLTDGRWLDDTGEAVVTSRLARERGLGIGDELTYAWEGRTSTVTVVGVIAGTGSGVVYTGWDTLAGLTGDLATVPMPPQYEIDLAGTDDFDAYAAAVADTGLGLAAQRGTDQSSYTLTIVSLATVLTLMLATVAALGVFNTVVLNTKDRRRDLAMLKSIGMTPSQVVTMTVTSMAVLGAIGGLAGIGIGAAAHRLVVPLAAEAAQLDLPDGTTEIWQPPVLAALALAGVVIAVLGALLPARAASRMTIAEALRTE